MRITEINKEPAHPRRLLKSTNIGWETCKGLAEENNLSGARPNAQHYNERDVEDIVRAIDQRVG